MMHYMSKSDPFVKLSASFPDAQIKNVLNVDCESKNTIIIEYAYGFIYISPRYGKKYRYPYPDERTDLVLSKIKGQQKDGSAVCLVDTRLTPVNAKKKCVWCGNETNDNTLNADDTVNKYPAFCCDFCRNKYKNYLRLTARLVKDGKLTKTERDWRLWASPIIETTANRSLLMQMIMDDVKSALSDTEKPIYPKISDDFAFYNDDIWYIQTCASCGKRFIARYGAKYCSDACRKKVSYQKNKKN